MTSPTDLTQALFKATHPSCDMDGGPLPAQMQKKAGSAIDEGCHHGIIRITGVGIEGFCVKLSGSRSCFENLGALGYVVSWGLQVGLQL